MGQSDILRQQADLMLKMADIMDMGDPLKTALERLDQRFPRKDSLGVPEMSAYWGVSENTARDRMHAEDFPAEKFERPIIVTKLALAMYEIRRAAC